MPVRGQQSVSARNIRATRPSSFVNDFTEGALFGRGWGLGKEFLENGNVQASRTFQRRTHGVFGVMLAVGCSAQASPLHQVQHNALRSSKQMIDDGVPFVPREGKPSKARDAGQSLLLHIELLV